MSSVCPWSRIHPRHPQNVLIPAVARGVQSKAFATIFQRSPLALGALPGTKLGSGIDLQGKRIGMHVDSIELMCSLMALSGSSAQVVEVQRAQKVQDLISGKVDAIQIYDCMVCACVAHLLCDTHTCTHSCAHVYACARALLCSHACTRAHTHGRVHAHTHRRRLSCADC